VQGICRGSLPATALAVLVLACQVLLRGKINARWRYALLLLPLLRLLLLWTP